MSRRLVHAGCLGVALVVFLGMVGLGVWLRAVAGFLVVPEALPDRADAIVVLGGGGRTATRETQAARLYEAGMAPVVVTTGGPASGEVAATYARWSVDRLVRRGVPREAVLATNVGNSTATDAAGVRQLAEVRGWRDLLIVTDEWHSRRTQLVFGRGFRDTPIRLHHSPAPDADFRVETWWLHEESAQAVVSEYVKLVAYLARMGD